MSDISFVLFIFIVAFRNELAAILRALAERIKRGAK